MMSEYFESTITVYGGQCALIQFPMASVIAAFFFSALSHNTPAGTDPTMMLQSP